MMLIIAFLLIIGVVLIAIGIMRIASGKDQHQQHDDGGRIEVVYRVPSSRDRRNRK